MTTRTEILINFERERYTEAAAKIAEWKNQENADKNESNHSESVLAIAIGSIALVLLLIQVLPL